MKSKITTGTLISAILVFGSACSSSPPPMVCEASGPPDAIAARPSPFDSAMARVDTAQLKLCYSRPSARGRTIFGGLVPYDTLWRTGANEATILHLSADAEIAGIPVEAGKYSIYTVPNPDQWSLVVNATTGQWGLTRDERGAEGNLFLNAYTDEVRARELGRRPIRVDSISYTEQLLAHFSDPVEDEIELWVDWETTRVVIPIRFQARPD